MELRLIDMVNKERLAAAVTAATRAIFQMFSLTVEEGDPAEPSVQNKNEGFFAMVKFSGGVEGTMIVHLTRHAAGGLAAAVYGALPEGADEQMRQAVTEAANMIAGGIRNDLYASGLNFEISIPEILHPEKIPPPSQCASDVSVPFRVNGHPLLITARLSDEKSNP